MTRLCHSQWVFMTQFWANLLILNGAPGRIRTSDPLVRSQILYPTELRARVIGGERGIRTLDGISPILP